MNSASASQAAPSIPAGRPAWREPLVWLVWGIPALTVVAGLATWWLAAQRADSNVADDWYRQGLTINRSLERTARAQALRVQGTLMLQPAHTLTLTLTAHAPLPAQLSLRLRHPVYAAQDQHWSLQRGPDGLYRTIDSRIAPGTWDVFVEGPDWRVGVQRAVLRESQPLALGF